MSRRCRGQAIFDTGLDEALDLLQLVELSATTRLDPSLRGERRRRDEQQPASGRGFAAAAMRERSFTILSDLWASGARDSIARLVKQ